jgi:caa(3)-type oxidase subunit IV
MALLDLIFLTAGAMLLGMLHLAHGHDDHEAPPPVEEHEDYHPHTALYLGIFGALCGLTVAELLVPELMSSFFALLVVTLTVLAFAKAGLVGFFFMHLKDEDWQVYLAVGLAVVGIILMVGPIVWDIGVVYGVYV